MHKHTIYGSTYIANMWTWLRFSHGFGVNLDLFLGRFKFQGVVFFLGPFYTTLTTFTQRKHRFCFRFVQEPFLKKRPEVLAINMLNIISGGKLQTHYLFKQGAPTYQKQKPP